MISLECDTIDLVKYSQRCRAYVARLPIYELYAIRYKASMSHSTRTVHVRITGQVQGVGFRAWTVELAEKFRLFGWVRNRRDGAVEALFHGQVNAVDAAIANCRRGPYLSRVKAVEILAERGETPERFEVRPTV